MSIKIHSKNYDIVTTHDFKFHSISFEEITASSIVKTIFYFNYKMTKVGWNLKFKIKLVKLSIYEYLYLLLLFF